MKGMCNTRCGSSADHVEHTSDEYKALVIFLDKEWKIE